MRYRLRTLLILLTVGPLLVAWWFIGDFDTLRFGKPLPVRGKMWKDNESCDLQYILAFQRRTALTKPGEPRTTWIIASDEPIDAKEVRRMVKDGAISYEPVGDSIYLPQPYLLLSFRASGDPGYSEVWGRTYGAVGYSGKVRFEEDRIVGRARSSYPQFDPREGFFPERRGGYKIWFNTTVEQY